MVSDDSIGAPESIYVAADAVSKASRSIRLTLNIAP